MAYVIDDTSSISSASSLSSSDDDFILSGGWQVTPQRNQNQTPMILAPQRLQVTADAEPNDAAMRRRALNLPRPSLYQPSQGTVFVIKRSDKDEIINAFFKWLADSAHEEKYNFIVRFEGEAVYGDGLMREFFRIVWEEHVIPAYFEDNHVIGLPLPSTHIGKMDGLATLGKFIALSLCYDFLPTQIHPLCYVRWDKALINYNDWHDLACYYDPVQTNMLPQTFEAFQALNETARQYFEAKYNFSVEICDFSEVTAQNFKIVLGEMYRRIVYPFAMQRTLSPVFEGINMVKRCLQEDMDCSATLLQYSADKLYETFKAASALSVDNVLKKTSFELDSTSRDPSVQMAVQKTYTVYKQTLHAMTSDELKRWCLFINNSTIVKPMRISVTPGIVAARTCFGTFQFGRYYDSKKEMLHDMTLMMTYGFGEMTEAF